MTDELTGAVAKGVRDALIAAHHATIDNHHTKADEARTAFMERGEREIAAIWREKGLPDFTDPAFSEEVRRAFGSINDPTHQFDFFWSIVSIIGLATAGSQAAAAGFVSQIQNHALHSAGDVQPDVGVVAAADNQGLMDSATAQDTARFTGYHAGSYEVIRAIAESWPALGEIFTMAHRGMPESMVDTMLRRQGYPIAIADLLKRYLLEGPPSADAAVTGRLKGHLDDAQAGAILSANGIDPTNLGWLRATAGRPPGIQELMTLWRRGKIDQAHLEGAIRQSDINDDYLPDILNLRYHSQPFRSIVASFRKKVIDEPTARLWLDYVGILPEQVDAIIREASTGTASATKHLSAQQYVALYEAQLWTRDQALAALEAINYDATDAGLELDLADHRKIIAAQTRSANLVGTRYTGWKIDRNTASQSLDALKVPAAARDSMLTDWDVIRETRTQHLTEAFMKKAHKAGHMTSADVLARLRAYGYDQVDADLIIATDFT